MNNIEASVQEQLDKIDKNERDKRVGLIRASFTFNPRGSSRWHLWTKATVYSICSIGLAFQDLIGILENTSGPNLNPITAAIYFVPWVLAYPLWTQAIENFLTRPSKSLKK